MPTKAAIILAAGKGSRMKSRTPKALHKVCGKEMARHVADAASSAGYDRIVIVVSPAGEDAFRAALGDGVEYVVQREPLGSAHAALQAKSALKGVDMVAALNGDMPLARPDTLRRQAAHHEDSGASATILTARVENPAGGRVVRDSRGAMARIVEEQDANERERGIREVNVGSYCFDGEWLWEALASVAPSQSGERYLPAVVACAARQGRALASVEVEDPAEAVGVNDRVELAYVESLLRARIRSHWMLNGVTMPHPETVYIDADVAIGMDTTIFPNTHVVGATRVGERCQIGPNAMIEHSVIGDDCRVQASVVERSELESGARVGPFTRIRPGCHVSEGAVLGNFAEINRSRVGRNAKSAHFSYLGDASIGENVNIGAGTVTANYDGQRKLHTEIGDGAFVGADTVLVAPVRIGEGSRTGAGAVVLEDVPPGSLAVGVPARVKGCGRPVGEGAESPPE